jgi:hypothetical protein
MIKRDGKNIVIVCDNCDAKITKKLSGLEILKMNAKLPDKWCFFNDKLFCSSSKCQNEIKQIIKRKNNSRKLSQQNWTNTR